MIAIIDYDMGNLRSVSKALEHVGAEACVTRDPKKIRDASKIVLPGVGAFPKCMENLQKYGLLEVIPDEIKKGKRFLGICLGFQLLFEESEEHGGSKGWGLLPGKVVRFGGRHSSLVARRSKEGKREPSTEHRVPSTEKRKIPHMGWNSACKVGDPLLLKGIDDETQFYFVHSYYVVPADESMIATTTEYGETFCSSIEKDNILACQFHPEKSQKVGLEVLRNFSTLK